MSGVRSLPMAQIGASEAEAERMLRSDPQLASALDDIEARKRLVTRTGYEVPYARSFAKLAGIGRKIDVGLYRFDKA